MENGEMIIYKVIKLEGFDECGPLKEGSSIDDDIHLKSETENESISGTEIPPSHSKMETSSEKMAWKRNSEVAIIHRGVLNCENQFPEQDSTPQKQPSIQKKSHRIERKCVICGKFTKFMSRHLDRQHQTLTRAQKQAYRIEMLEETPIKKKSGQTSEKERIRLKCPLCQTAVIRVDDHLFHVHKLQRSSFKMKELVAQAKEMPPSQRKMETSSEKMAWKRNSEVAINHGGVLNCENQFPEQDSTPQKQPSIQKKSNRIQRVCSICGNDIKYIRRHLDRKHGTLTRDQKQAIRIKMLEETPIKKKSGQTTEKERIRLKCPLCQTPVIRVDDHLFHVHKLQRSSSKMKELVAQAKGLDGSGPLKEGSSIDDDVRVKSETENETFSGSEMPPSQRKMETSSEKMAWKRNSEVAINHGGVLNYENQFPEQDSTPQKQPSIQKKSHRIERKCVICGIVTKFISRHLDRQHQTLTCAQKQAYRIEMLEETPIRKKNGQTTEKERMRLKCPLCQTPVIRVDDHLFHFHKLQRSSSKMKELVSQAKGTQKIVRRPRETEGATKLGGTRKSEQLSSEKDSPLLEQLSVMKKPLKDHRIQRDCIICGKVVKYMTRHLSRKHPTLNENQRHAYRVQMLENEPIKKKPYQTGREKTRFKCPLCQMSALRVDDHLVHVHQLQRRSCRMKELVSQAKGKFREGSLQGTKEQLCFVCGKIFRSKGNLVRHMIIHSGKRPYSCSICNRSFTFRSSLSTHMGIHSREKTHRCAECDGRFSNSCQLRMHVKRIHEVKGHQCFICDKVYSQAFDLKKHMETHTGERAYECPVCNKAFISKGMLTGHMKIHSEENPHRCCVCKRAFSRQIHLDRHMNIHSAAKPYHCELCGIGFSKRSVFTQHMTSHKNEAIQK